MSMTPLTPGHEPQAVREHDARRITLAPPIARAVMPLHPGLYTVFRMIPCLRTHLLCWIAKP